MKLLIRRRAPNLVLRRSAQLSRRDPTTNRRFVCGAWLISVCCLQLWAENVVLTGAISGPVTDASGAVVSGTSLVSQSLNAGLQQSTATNRNGLYHFSVLVPGTYSVTVSGKGFREAASLVQVLVGNNTVHGLRLHAGASGEMVKVVAATALLRPTQSSASSALARSLINDLPLNGASPMATLLLPR